MFWQTETETVKRVKTKCYWLWPVRWVWQRWQLTEDGPERNGFSVRFRNGIVYLLPAFPTGQLTYHD